MDVDHRLMQAPPIDSRSLTEAVLHSIPDAAAILDSALSVVALNESFEELCGMHRDRLIGHPIWQGLPELSPVMSAALDAGCAWETRVELAAGGRQKTLFHIRLRPVFHDSTKLSNWIIIISSPKKSHHGQDLNDDSLDPLTNLPTFGLVRDKLHGLLDSTHQPSTGVAVFCIDLDGFDNVNRQYGRGVGDLVLVETARRLGRRMRASNTVGRIAEDMFVVVVPELRGTEQITAVATRLLGGISQPFIVQGVSDPIILSASIGIAIAPDDGNTPEELLQKGQTAVDSAKRAAAGTYQFFSNTSGKTARERRSRVNLLRRAIADDQMFLHYQPKVSVATGKVVGAEALVRWRDSDGNTIMPDDFIPLAEDAGLIEELGEQVLRQACETWTNWQQPGCPFVRIAVNVSAKQIARRQFLSILEEIIDETGIPYDALELEITESSVMEQAEDVIKSLRRIRELGIHLCADDFGTGYASLSYLRDFPIDGIKIDTTFVAGIENPEDGGGLAAGVVAVGHSLGMRVVAEGVETEHQMNFLRWHGCDEVQGYFVSPPLGPDEFCNLIKQEGSNA